MLSSKKTWVMQTSLSALVMLTGASCGKKKEKKREGDKPTSIKSSSRLQALMEKEMKKGQLIEKFNVRIKLPKGGQIVPVYGKPSWAGVRVGKCTVLLQPLQGPQDSTFEFEVGLATKGMATKIAKNGRKTHIAVLRATKWIHKRKLPDGFLLEYEGIGSGGKVVRSVVVRRHIGNHHIRCSEGTLSGDDSCVKKVCLALRPGS